MMFGRKKRTLAPFSELVPGLYNRVSTDEQGGANNVSLPDQEQASRWLANQLGMPVYEEYILYEDESGTKLDERPQLTVLRNWIRQGKINAVIVRSTDRLSRRLRHGIELIEEMRKYGVRFFVTHWNREFDLHSDADVEYLQEEFRFAEKWGKMAAQTMAWGRRGRIERGSAAMGGSDRYGWKRIRLENKMLIYEHDEQEAQVIQNVFHWFTRDRVGVAEIQRRLRGTPTPKESRDRTKHEKMDIVKKRGYGEWATSTIYIILRDPTYYQGYVEWYTDSEEYEPVQVPIPPIISEKAWLEAQELLNDGKRASKRNSKHDFLMRGLLTCSCGASIRTVYKNPHGKEYWRYQCAKATNRYLYANRECASAFKSYDAQMLDDKIWAWVLDIAETPQLLRAYLEEAQKTIDQFNAPILERLRQIEDARVRYQNKMSLMADLALEKKEEARKTGNEHAVDEVNAMLKRLYDEARDLLNELQEEEDKARARLLPYAIDRRLIEDWERYLTKINTKAAHYSFEQKRSDIEALHIKGVWGTNDEGQKVLWIYLYGSTEPADMILLESANSIQDSPL
jgi:site-specific DNA recombinase